MSRRRLAEKRHLSEMRRTELRDRSPRTTAIESSRYISQTMYEHSDCGVDCRACDAELALEGRPDEVRWDDDVV